MFICIVLLIFTLFNNSCISQELTDTYSCDIQPFYDYLQTYENKIPVDPMDYERKELKAFIEFDLYSVSFESEEKKNRLIKKLIDLQEQNRNLELENLKLKECLQQKSEPRKKIVIDVDFRKTKL